MIQSATQYPAPVLDTEAELQKILCEALPHPPLLPLHPILLCLSCPFLRYSPATGFYHHTMNTVWCFPCLVFEEKKVFPVPCSTTCSYPPDNDSPETRSCWDAWLWFSHIHSGTEFHCMKITQLIYHCTISGHVGCFQFWLLGTALL